MKIVFPFAGFPLEPAVHGITDSVGGGRECSFFDRFIQNFPELAGGAETDPMQLATRLNLMQTGDEDQILEWVKQAHGKNAG